MAEQQACCWLQSIRHIAFLLSSGSEGGLQAVQSSHIRLQDATSPAVAQIQSLGWLCLPGAPTSKAANLLLCKLHKVSNVDECEIRDVL